MFILKSIGQIVHNGKLKKQDIYISAPTIDECFLRNW